MKLLTPPYLLRVLFSTIAVSFLSGSIAESIERVSVPQAGGEADGFSTAEDVTPDGRFVVFSSSADNLVDDDTNGEFDVFLVDRNDGSIERISVDSDEAQTTDSGSDVATISDDGRFVCFRSNSSELLPVGEDTNGTYDIFVRDRANGGSTFRVSLDHMGNEITGESRSPIISGDGTYVVFYNADANVVPGDMNGGGDIFRVEVANPAAVRVSVSNSGGEANGSSHSPSISSDGNLVAFISSAENLVGTDDTNGEQDMFVRNVSEGTTTRVSLTSTGGQQEGGGTNESGEISSNGRYVVFGSSATNLTPEDTNGKTDVFLRDLQENTTELISVASNSSAAITDGNSTSFPTVSPNGRYVGFESDSRQLDSRDTSGAFHGFIRDRQTKTTQTVNITENGTVGTQAGPFDPRSNAPLFANNGVYVFSSDSDNLVSGDTNDAGDVFQSEYIPLPPPAAAAPAAPSNAALCASLKKKLKKLKKKQKKAKRTKKIAKAKRLKKKIKKIKKKLKALGC